MQNYFAEYHLEYYRQRRYNHFPSRLHALLLFATRTDAMTFRSKHPQRVFAKSLVCAKTKGAYICSFHDASWLITCACHTACRSARWMKWPTITGQAEPWKRPA